MAAGEPANASDPDATADFLRHWFVNREDIYAVETEAGWRSRRVTGGMTDAALASHLRGDLTLGVYTTDVEDRVRWVCFDVDTDETAPLMALISVLPQPFMVEDTGGRGRHVWQFFSTRVPAGTAKAYGEAMVRRAGVSKVEVYPKQAHLEGGLGNLVRLPLGKHHSTGRRSHWVMGGWGYLDPSYFLSVANSSTREPARERTAEAASDQWISAMFDGDTEAHGGRNNTLSRFAYLLYNLGCTPDFVRVAVEYVNNNCIEPLPVDEVERLLVAKQRTFERRGQ